MRKLILLKNTNPSSENFYITEMGYSKRFGNDYTIGPRIRNDYLIHIIISGCCVFGNERLGRGKGFFICPNQLHKFTVKGDALWEHYWIGFGGSGVRKMLEDEGLPQKNSTLFFNLTDSAQSIFESFFENSNSNTLNDAFGKSFLYYILSLLPMREREPISASEKAAAIMDRQYADKISVEDIAGMLHISSKHLYRVFIRDFNTSPQQYLINTRINNGEALLKTTNLTVGEIAYSIGFNSPFHFSQMFKKYKGLSPTDYRKELHHP